MASRKCYKAAKVLRRIWDLVEGRHKPTLSDSDWIDALLREFKKLPNSRTMPLSFGLNNFHGRLPGGYQRRFDLEALCTKPEDSRFSKRRQRRSLAEFHEDVDRTILEVGLDPKEILKLQGGRDLPALNRYVMPLYKRLRVKGYKRYPDLVA